MTRRATLRTDRERLDHARAIIERALIALPAVLAELGDEANGRGFPSRTPGSGEPGGGGGVGDPTSRAALACEIGIEDLETLANLTEQLLHRATILQDLMARVMARTATRPALTPAERGLQACGNPHGCPDGLWAVPGRQGRCETCARYRKDHQGMDRVARYGRTRVA